MVPLYLHYMDLSDYGAWLASGSVMSFVGILEAGFGSVITQRMAAAEGSNNKHLFLRLSSANIIIALFIAIFITLIGVCLSPFIPTWVQANKSIYHDLELGIIFSSISTGLTLLGAQVGVFPQVWQETFYMGLINTISIILGVITIYFSLISGWGVASIGLGYLVRSCTNFLGISIHVINNWHKKRLGSLVYSKTVLKGLARDCSLPFLSKISSTLLNNSQNFLIANSISPAMAAIYDVTGKVINVIRIFVGNINGSVFGSFSFIFAGNDIPYKRNSFYKLDLVHFTMLTVGMSMSFLFSRDIIGFWVGKDKFGGYLLLILILASVFITERKSLSNTLIMTMGMIQQSAIFDIINTLVYIFILFILVQLKCGIYTVPLAIILSSLYFLYKYESILAQGLIISLKSRYFNNLKNLLLAIGLTGLGFYVIPEAKNISMLLFDGTLFFLLYLILLLKFNQSLRSFFYPYVNNLFGKLKLKQL